MASNYLAELEAIQRWVKATAGLNSMRLQTAPPKVARPVILWEAPSRSRDRNITRWLYVNQVTQYGKLYANDLGHLLDFQDKLFSDLEERVGVLPVYNQAGQQIGKLEAVQLTFRETEGLDVPIEVQYQVTYSRTKPVEPPAPTAVYTKVTYQEGGSADGQ